MEPNDSAQKQFTDLQKEYIVERLACFAKPTVVAAEVKELFGLEASLTRLRFYDATTPQGQRELSKELKKRFADIRRAYLADVDAVPIAHTAVRLRELQAMLDDEANERNPFLRKDLLLQAAKDVGGMLTNKRVLETPAQSASGSTLDLKRLNATELTELQTLVDKATVPTGDPGGTEPPPSG